MKARPSLKKKSKPARLRLHITHTAASRAAVSEQRLRRVARLALLAATSGSAHPRQDRGAGGRVDGMLGAGRQQAKPFGVAARGLFESYGVRQRLSRPGFGALPKRTAGRPYFGDHASVYCRGLPKSAKASGLPQGRFAIALAFVTDARMRRLNREFADNDYVTDVLSFAAREDAGTFRVPPSSEIVLGDIVIALPQAARQARQAAHPLARELDLLVAHGVLHLLGYDHGVPADARRMEALQAQILASAPTR